jgi:hypothetical protein
VLHPSDAAIEWRCHRLAEGEDLEGLFRDRWIDVARFNRIDRRHARPGLPIKVPSRLDDIADFTPLPRYYEAAAFEPKFILADLSEQFLGAYEFGRLVFSSPITTGESGNETVRGEFRITAVHREHRSTLYTIEGTEIPYPMTYALQFHTTRSGVRDWIHGRDLPGAPASHGCIGLYDEAMQKQYYGVPAEPVLGDAKMLFEWVIHPLQDGDKLMPLAEGPRVLVRGQTPGTAESLSLPADPSHC